MSSVILHTSMQFYFHGQLDSMTSLLANSPTFYITHYVNRLLPFPYKLINEFSIFDPTQ